jgi:hypothetical protein
VGCLDSKVGAYHGRTLGQARIGALSWKQSSSGGSPPPGTTVCLPREVQSLIHLRDPRSDSPYEMRLCAYKQEVCGLKWSFDERSMLASGGNATSSSFGISRSIRHPSTRLGSTPPPSRLSLGVLANMDYSPVSSRCTRHLLKRNKYGKILSGDKIIGM